MLAHIVLLNDERVEQTIKEHCLQVAYYAGESLKAIGLYHTAYLAGLLHDCGKATQRFQDYLEHAFSGIPERRGSVNHTFAGVVYILERWHQPENSKWEKLTAEIIGYAIGAHHGLFDCVDLSGNGNHGFQYRLEKDREEIHYDEAIQNFFGEVITEKEVEKYFELARQEVEQYWKDMQKHTEKKKENNWFYIGLLCRMLLSAVINGDRRDTREFMQQQKIKEVSVLWQEELQFLENKLSEYSSDSELNRVRSQISEQCAAFADHPTGIYRLNVPTGGGKSLSVLRFALKHAEVKVKKRIIVVIPLLSVLDQNAKVIREHLQHPNIVLEHHSNIIKEDMSEDELNEYELFSDNWSSPVVITTLVQLLNSLYAKQNSAVGRMQALCNSIIVIDEVQSIPHHLLSLFNAAMNFLSETCKATIVLCSATQPCLESIPWNLHLAANSDIVQLDSKQQNVFKRATIMNYINNYGMDMEMFVDFCLLCIQQENSLLVICNTKDEARNLYVKLNKLADNNSWRIFHLSTSMCQANRIKILDEVRKSLALLQNERYQYGSIEKVICISTQMVEAGVDFSFSCVVRVLAGIDNLAQAAGRCNRSNEYGEKGTVYLVNLKHENLRMLPDIQDAQNSTRYVLQNKLPQEEIILNDTLVNMYYQTLFMDGSKLQYMIRDEGISLQAEKLLANEHPYVNQKCAFCLRQPFLSVAKQFQVIKSDTIGVIVPYGKGRDIIEELQNIQKEGIQYMEISQLLQKAKAYTINVYQYQLEKLFDVGLVQSLFDGSIWILDAKAYDAHYGLNLVEEQSVDEYIL